MSIYMNGGKFIEHYNGKDIYEENGKYFIIKPASYSCCATKESYGMLTIESCREYIDYNI